jgi:hypothetical protein
MSVRFNASASRDDVEITNYTWEFTHNDTSIILYGESPEYLFWTPGTYAVNLTVEDAAGNRASNVVAVTVGPLGDDADIQWGYYIISIIVSAAIILLALWIRKGRAAEHPAEDAPEQTEVEP